MPPCVCCEAELVEHRGEELAVLRHLDAGGWVPMMVQPLAARAGGEVERRLAAELDDDGVRSLPLVDVQHVFERERLEVELVAGVVVGGDGLGIRVDHDGFQAELLEREGGVDAAVVELDALADAVRSAAEDHDLLFLAGAGLVFVAVGGIVIGRVGLELRGAGVDEAVGGEDARGLAGGADLRLGAVGERWRAGGRRSRASFALPEIFAVRPSAIRDSSSTICLMFSRNHGSIAESSWICSHGHTRPAGRSG